LKIYMIGSLRNAAIPEIAKLLRSAFPTWEIFDDWHSAGPHADDCWRDYEKDRGRSFIEALSGHAAKNVFAFDKRHLDSSDAVVLVAPAGKSGHLELGYMLGKGKPGFVLIDSPDRWDVMYQFATGVTDNPEELTGMLRAVLDTTR
jgi:hypothetical protein